MFLSIGHQWILIVVFLCKDIPVLSVTPGQDGCNSHSVCTKLKDCKPFMELLKLSGMQFRTSVMKFFKSQMCGLRDNEPKVCCIQLALNISIGSPDKGRKLTSCRRNFRCIDLFRCDPLTSLAASDADMSPVVDEFIKSQQCGSRSGYPLVCCKTKLNDKSPDGISWLTSSKSAADNPNMGNSQSTQLSDASIRDKVKSKNPAAEKINYLNNLSYELFDVLPFDLLRRRRQFINLEPDVEIR